MAGMARFRKLDLDPVLNQQIQHGPKPAGSTLPCRWIENDDQDQLACAVVYKRVNVTL
ncbi:Hypothetical protein GbCGDNIH1_8038 [Granulibacter bethesdensis CGDNIH1]|uniref:Uncharacterized protein n=1 Tax=Granulibacter bethesdensis (strain ATCC BAA-1260 / CGDNIH1) TaxID=391165 RepID=A0A286M391_GRABC|nr:Hypothetical protein GbCGDNIH1I4_8038 [Granulibacter bethesdensis]ASV62490.1 Hypothetical protein GbCGDNIH1_8038 [Granulibacter bethesdensis CGDNIH1]